MKYINQKDYPHWLYVTRIDLDEADRERGKTTTVGLLRLRPVFRDHGGRPAHPQLHL